MQYFLYINDEVRGPYGEYELHDMLAHHEVQPDVLASPGGESEWKSLQEVLGLSAARPSMRRGTSFQAPQQTSVYASSPRNTQGSKGQFSRKESEQFQPQEACEPAFRSPLWQVAAGLVVAYVALGVANSLYDRFWDDSAVEQRPIFDVFLRSIGGLYFAYDLSRAKAWAYWAMICGSGLLGFAGVVAFFILLEENLLHEGPYSYLSLGLQVLATATLCMLFAVLLILPLHKAPET